VSDAVWATPVMVEAISVAPVAASATLRLISLVVAVCSSTAEAMVAWVSLICWMIAEIWVIAVTAAYLVLVETAKYFFNRRFGVSAPNGAVAGK